MAWGHRLANWGQSDAQGARGGRPARQSGTTAAPNAQELLAQSYLLLLCGQWVPGQDHRARGLGAPYVPQVPLKHLPLHKPKNETPIGVSQTPAVPPSRCGVNKEILPGTATAGPHLRAPCSCGAPASSAAWHGTLSGTPPL